mmetsp:Transcript_2079/g.4472  ORF Transcript_2079/g.4472 Transcript_2079/m.4472 type:complete len:366 (-) Transcript_2079:98-1195(-)
MEAMHSFLEADELQLLLLMKSRRHENPASAVVASDDEAPGDDLPRVPFDVSFGLSATPTGLAAFVSALAKHGYVILTGVCEGEALYRTLEASLKQDLFLLKALTPASDTSAEACGSARKEAFVGSVYFNERSVPMWRSGYEFVEDKVREAFRVHAGETEEGLAWPSKNMQRHWAALTAFCRDLTDRALVQVLTSQPPGVPRTAGDLDRCRRLQGDLSVAYALHYPNEQGAALPLDVTGGQPGINVKAHVDPSLLVVEPVADVPGLDVFDQTLDGGLGKWVSVERACAPASSWVVFGGRCLEAATQGRIKACLHRVTTPNHNELAARGAAQSGGNHCDIPREAGASNETKRRFCFIFEQKLSDFYE